MLKLLSRFKHEEFESNLELQVRNKKKKEAITRRREEVESKAAKFLQPAKFRNLQIFAGCEIASCTTVHLSLHCSLSCAFLPFWLFCHFLVCFPFYPLCNSDSSCNLVILLVLVAI